MRTINTIFFVLVVGLLQAQFNTIGGGFGSAGAGGGTDSSVVSNTNGIILPNFASEPTGQEGAIYYDTINNLFRGYQNGGWQDLVYSSGWASYSDTTFDVTNKLVVNEGDTTQITIDNGITITSYLPFGVDSLWDSANNKIISSELGAQYSIRLDFKASTSAATGGYGSIIYNIGG